MRSASLLCSCWWQNIGCESKTVPEDVDGDGYSVAAGDCDDGAADVHPMLLSIVMVVTMTVITGG